ncbi:26S proteasome regulatory subunit rpn14 [Clonorchis sinensis]|uniref:26S proteasome regulatory subunit rpn14 n=2 Tax=Clonorchis sinensis TaxID=79923 RepID=A0A8T1MZX3_CLOSI|nr:26S proteasome regulatory subunit rpn14 [Clonorchis sinensis]
MQESYVGFRIQPDWDKAFSEKDSQIWIHEYEKNNTTYHKLCWDGEEFVPDTDSFSYSLKTPSVIQLRSKTRDLVKTFQSPDFTIRSEYSDDRQPRVHLTCMDIGPTGELGLAASSDKSVNLWETDTGHVRRTLDGHVGEVYSCRFFPSGLAALTAGADMQLKIWCLLSGTCAATLAPGSAGAMTGTSPLDDYEPGGHRSGILDTGIIQRGRNILAIDRLGWLRLWDVSTQICISGIPLIPNAARCPRSNCPVLEEATCLAVKKQRELPLCVGDVSEEHSSSWFHVLQTRSPRATEVGTSDAVVAVGMGSGASVQLYELGARTRGCVARFTLPHATGSIESCVFPQSIDQPPLNDEAAVREWSCRDTTAFYEYAMYAGGQNGELCSWDLRFPKEPLMKLSGEKGAVQRLCAVELKDSHRVLLLVGRSDGRVQVYSYNPLRGSSLTKFEDHSELVKSTLELTGINCEPIRGLIALPRAGGTDLSVWTGSFSGVFRFYQNLATKAAFD